jgi:hypothetical protein
MHRKNAACDRGRIAAFRHGCRRLLCSWFWTSLILLGSVYVVGLAAAVVATFGLRRGIWQVTVSPAPPKRMSTKRKLAKQRLCELARRSGPKELEVEGVHYSESGAPSYKAGSISNLVRGSKVRESRISGERRYELFSKWAVGNCPDPYGIAGSRRAPKSGGLPY